MSTTKTTTRRKKVLEIERILRGWLVDNLENVDRLTVRQIAEQTGLAKTAVHRHLPRMVELRRYVLEMKGNEDSIELPDPFGIWVAKALYARWHDLESVAKGARLTKEQVVKCLKEPPLYPINLVQDVKYSMIVNQVQLWRDIEKNRPY